MPQRPGVDHNEYLGKEAVDGEELRADDIRIAPGGEQLELVVRDGILFTKLKTWIGCGVNW